MSHHVVRVCPLELFDDVLQLASMALCAEEPLETALALLQDAFEILFYPFHITGRRQCTYMGGTTILLHIPR